MLRRVRLSLQRRLKETLLLFSILLLLGIVLAGALATQMATRYIISDIQNKLPAMAELQLDHKVATQNKVDILKENGLTVELIERLGQLPQVAAYDYSLNHRLYIPAVHRVIDEEEEKEAAKHWFELKGTNQTSLLSEDDRQHVLISGRYFTAQEITSAQNVTIISQDVAHKNNLAVGDQLIIENRVPILSERKAGPDDVMLVYATEVIDLTIVGIIAYPKQEAAIMDKSSETPKIEQRYNPYVNSLYTPNEVVKQRIKFSETKVTEQKPTDPAVFGLSYNPTFILKSFDEQAAFIASAEQLLPPYYKVNIDTTKYDRIAGTVVSMEMLARYILYFVIVAEVIVLILFLLLMMRQRKYEFGVYLALGRSKLTIIGQIFSEIILVATLSLVIAVFGGILISQNMAQTMLQQQLVSQQDISQQLRTEDSETIALLEQQSYVFQTDMSFFVVYYVIELSIISLTVLLASIAIVRMSPTILLKSH